LQEAHYLTLEIYRATDGFPKSEVEGLQGEMRRLAITCAGKIARATGVLDQEDRDRSLSRALRAATELLVRIDMVRTLEYLESDAADELERQVQRIEFMLKRLIYRSRVGPRKRR
jgi:four helix bundle protein